MMGNGQAEAMALPRPDPPPVTRTTLPETSKREAAENWERDMVEKKEVVGAGLGGKEGLKGERGAEERRGGAGGLRVLRVKI